MVMQPMKTVLLLFCAGVLVLAGSRLVGAQTTQPAGAGGADKSADEAASQYLGERFSTLAGGVSFRPPAGGRQIKPANVGTNIVQYVNIEEKWTLKVTRMLFEQPTLLRGKDDLQTPIIDESKTRPGVLDQVVQQIMFQAAGTRILRQDVINVGPHDAGILILRYSQGLQTYLRQMALIQKNDQLYYVFDLTTPSARTAADREDEEDAAETLAVQIFNQMLDTVELLDQSMVLLENDARLYRTRVLMTNLSGRMNRAARAEQYFRILKNGKDIGWMLVSEEPGERQGQKGLFAAVASGAMPEPGIFLETASEMFCADDRQTEAWVTITVAEKDGKLDHVSEFGQSRVVRVRDEVGGQGDPLDRNQPKYREVPQISVTQTSALGSTPVTRPLRWYYTPQAVGHMLPRLVPLDEAKGYLFQTWVAGEHELGNRFIDVERPRMVNFTGQNTLAMVVKDRIGLEGDPTLHYLTADGHYLGSETPATGIRIVASDLKALSNLWPKARIVRPKVLDVPLTGHKSTDKK
jgi:hypothetical protein